MTSKVEWFRIKKTAFLSFFFFFFLTKRIYKYYRTPLEEVTSILSILEEKESVRERKDAI